MNVTFLLNFSENLAKHTEDFVCSVIVGQDLIPRLSLSSMEELKCNLLRVTRDSQEPKVFYWLINLIISKLQLFWLIVGTKFRHGLFCNCTTYIGITLGVVTTVCWS